MIQQSSNESNLIYNHDTIKDAYQSEKQFTITRGGVSQLKRYYDVSKVVLGKGNYGKVFLATKKSDPSMNVAIKVMSKLNLSNDELLNIQTEVKILSQLDHINVVKFLESFDDVKFIYLVMEYCPGGDLLDHMNSNFSKYDEQYVAHIAYKVLQALKYLNDNNIVHRDIKPENILFGFEDEIKLIDFGLAQYLKSQ